MKLSYIALREGEKHPLCFSLSAMEHVVEEFGDIESMFSKMQSDNMGERIHTITTLLNILIDSGRKYCDLMGIEMPPPIRGNVGDLIDVTDADAIRAIFNVITNDTQRTVEAKSKNADPTLEAN